MKPRGRILIIDDDATARIAAAVLLEGEGYEVHGATDASQALPKMEGFAPDVVLVTKPIEVDQLMRVVATAVAGCRDAGDRQPPIPGATIDELERYAILRTLEHTHGSTSRAAEILGISARKIQYKLHEYQARRGDVSQR